MTVRRAKKKLRVYLDTSILGAPFDRSGALIYRAAELALLLAARKVAGGEWDLVSSAWLDVETERDGDRRRRVAKRRILRMATARARTTETRVEALRLEGLGFGAHDAGHLASAEFLGADVLLTVDGEFEDLTKQKRAQIRYHVEVLRPGLFLDRFGDAGRVGP